MTDLNTALIILEESNVTLVEKTAYDSAWAIKQKAKSQEGVPDDYKQNLFTWNAMVNGGMFGSKSAILEPFHVTKNMWYRVIDYLLNVRDNQPTTMEKIKSDLHIFGNSEVFRRWLKDGITEKVGRAGIVATEKGIEKYTAAKAKFEEDKAALDAELERKYGSEEDQMKRFEDIKAQSVKDEEEYEREWRLSKLKRAKWEKENLDPKTGKWLPNAPDRPKDL